MADNFVALLHCKDRTHVSENTLQSVESCSLPELNCVLTKWESCGYFSINPPKSCWVDFGEPGLLPLSGGVDFAQISRPLLPDVDHPFLTNEGTRLYFGEDYVAAKHPISWGTFERDEEWLWLLIDAAKSLGSLFEANEGYMISDCSPAATEIENGKTFADLMAAPFAPEYQQWGRIRPIAEFPSAAKEELFTERDYWKFL